MTETEASVPAALRERIAELDWYHTLELGPGLVTPGYFDLRRTVNDLPWPEVRGKRCLDVGTCNGFFAFELERRGAAEVIAADVSDYEGWDWPPDVQSVGEQYLDNWKDVEFEAPFRAAKEALGSKVERVEVSAYDLSPEKVGEFDVVVAGSILLHLRDPVRALAAMRSVCRGHLLSADQVNLRLSVTARKREIARLIGWGPGIQWWEPNCTGHKQMLWSAGFEIDQEYGPYAIDFGEIHPPRGKTWRAAATRAFRRAFAGGDGVPHQALLAHPRF